MKQRGCVLGKFGRRTVVPRRGARAFVSLLLAACSGSGSPDTRANSPIPTGPVVPPAPRDSIAPTTPDNLRIAATSSTSLAFAWRASTDNVGVTGYQIYRNGVLVGTSATAAATDSGLSPSTTYTYRVAATDAAGNASPLAAAFVATTTNGTAFTMTRRLGVEVAGWHWGYGGGSWRPEVDDDLIQSAKDVGVSVVHLMLPLVEQPLGTYLEKELVKLDYFLAAAAQRNMLVMPSLLNIYGNAAVQTGDPYYNPTGIEGLVFDGPIKTAFRNRIAMLVNRTNTFNGRKYKDDPTIFAWIIGDEPISAAFNYPVRSPNLTVQQFRAWLEETAAFISGMDSKHPVTIYIHPAQNSLKDGDWVESLAAPSVAFSYGEDADMRILTYFKGYDPVEYPLRLQALGRPLAMMISFTSGTWPESICHDYAFEAQMIERAAPAYLNAGVNLVLVQFWESDLFPSLSAMPFCHILTDSSAPVVAALKKVSASMSR